MARPIVDLRSTARSHTESAIRTLALIASQSESDSARVAAAIHLLDRGWGKPATTHTGADGDGDIKVVIRHIVEGRDGVVIEQTRQITAVTPDDTVEG